jgi:hypothetical protein
MRRCRTGESVEVAPDRHVVTYRGAREIEVATKEDLDRKGGLADVIRGDPMTAEGSGHDSKMIEGGEGQTFRPGVSRQRRCQNLP